MRPRSSRPSSLRLSRRATGARSACAQRVRLVPGPKSARPPALRLRDWRLQRRPRRDRHQRQTRAPNPRLRLHRAQLLLDAAALPAPDRTKIRASGVTSNHEVFRRHAGNPILTAADWSQPVNAVFNPAAAPVDGETVVLARVEDRRGISHLGVARSADGLSGWSIDPEPLLAPADVIESESGASKTHVQSGAAARALADHVHGVRPERPGRLSRVDDGFSDGRADGIICQPEDKNAALCPSGSTDSGFSSPADDVLRRFTRR